MANKRHLEILKQGVRIWNEWRKENPDERPDFSNAELSDINLRNADIRNVDFRNANLMKGDLRNADISKTNFTNTNLIEAKLNETFLAATFFNRTYLVNTNFEKSILFYTKIVDCDLSWALKLNTVVHQGPSTIGIDTIYKSKGEIPASFLKGCGIPEYLVGTILPLVRERHHELNSCFISYSSKDEIFAKRLKNHLESKNINN